jgi:hypothetical protein
VKLQSSGKHECKSKQTSKAPGTDSPPPGEERFVESDDLECFVLDFNLALSSSVTGSWGSAQSQERERAIVMFCSFPARLPLWELPLYANNHASSLLLY